MNWFGFKALGHWRQVDDPRASPTSKILLDYTVALIYWTGVVYWCVVLLYWNFVLGYWSNCVLYLVTGILHTGVSYKCAGGL